MIDTSRIPLQSFDPRYREILLRGAREEFTIPCGTASRAHRLQMMLCQYRSRMKKRHFEETALWEPLYDCVVGKVATDLSTLRLYPRHSEFDDILSKVEQIDTPKAREDILAELEEELRSAKPGSDS